jgi:hypothetical protein
MRCAKYGPERIRARVELNGRAPLIVGTGYD